MIFKRQPKKVNSNATRTKSWKQKFKLCLYQQNYKSSIQNCSWQQNTLIQNNRNRNQAGINLIEHVRANYTKYYQKGGQDVSINHQYCSIIPLKKSVQLDDEIVNTFLYLRNLKQCNSLLEEDNFYTEIRKFLKYCKQNNKISEGWLVCLNRFTIGLDIIKKIQIYNYLLKYGSSQIDNLHRKYAKNSLVDIFIHSIFTCKRYFQKQVRINKTLKISLEVSDKINQANISKTMKMLYCSICLIYDCGKHKIEDHSHHKHHHYCSPKNIIPKSIHISKAIQLLKGLRDLQTNIKVPEQQCCSDLCFKNIKKQSYDLVQVSKSRIISPMVQSIIKMGVQMFSYNSCSISNLFPKEASPNSKVTCSIIFLYLIEQLNVSTRLSCKINENQVQHLKKQRLVQLPYHNFEDNYRRNKALIPMKKKKMRKQNTEDFKYQQTAICFHCYIGQQTFDHNCQNCVCSRRGFCLPECQCGPDCLIMIKGCNCKNRQDCQTIKCICYKTKTQCIPGICTHCFPAKNSLKKNLCKNDQILKGMRKSIKVGMSKIEGAGFGAFATQKIKKGSLISVYCGEVLDQQMQGIRQTLKKGESFYNFACSEGSIDARFMGNKTRFINHGNQKDGNTNLVSLNMFSCGQQYIGLYALRDIQIGQQLLFDYDGEGEIAKDYSEVYSFLRKQNNCLKLQKLG